MGANTHDQSHARVRAAVRDYLNKWEAWEKENGRDANIGNSEWVALSLIAQRSFQELDDHNYVGDLNEWMTKNGNGGGIPWEEKEFPDPVTKQRMFRASIRIPSIKGVFPREGHGFGPGEKAPEFTVKKKAKQFAAKCVLAWLKDHENPDSGSSDSDLDDSDSDNEEGDTLVEKTEDMSVTTEIPEVPDTSIDKKYGNAKANRPAPPAENSPDRKKVKVSEMEAQAGAPLTSPRPGIFSKSYPSTSDEPPSLPKKVEALARTMGFDIPKYTVTCEVDETWSGRLVFQLDGRMPEDLGTVTGMESEAHARAEMAQTVLAWLTREHKRRSSECDRMIEGLRVSQDNPLVNGMLANLDEEVKT